MRWAWGSVRGAVVPEPQWWGAGGVLGRALPRGVVAAWGGLMDMARNVLRFVCDAMGTYLDHASQHLAIRFGRGRASWLDLVAETTAGVGAVACHRVRVRGAKAICGGKSCRVLVQCYRRSDVAADLVPWPGARPRGAAQRVVSGEELERGVEIGIVDLVGADDVVAIAWVEPTVSALEFEGWAARLDSSLPWGAARLDSGERAEIVLGVVGPGAVAA